MVSSLEQSTKQKPRKEKKYKKPYVCSSLEKRVKRVKESDITPCRQHLSHGIIANLHRNNREWYKKGRDISTEGSTTF